MADVIQLDPHTSMTVNECLEYCRLEQADYEDVIVLGYDKDGELILRSSRMTNKDALWLLMVAVDQTRGVR
jgi:hypothetical protein